MSRGKVVPDSKTVSQGRCTIIGKVAYKKEVAIRRAALWKPDDRGSWNAYQCKFSPEHWHVGHTRREPVSEAISKGDTDE